MNRYLSQGAVALLLMGFPSLAAAQGRSFTDRTVPGMQQADRHNPFSRNYTDMTPGGYARRQFGGSHRPGSSYWIGHPWAYGYHNHGYFGHGYYDYGPTFFDAPWGMPGGWEYAMPSPPLFVAPEAFFPPPFVANPPAAAPPVNNIQPPKKDAVPAPRQVNAETLARAGRIISAGDGHFAAQRYREANQRYRNATEVAPELPEAFFRQGQALVAMGQYDLAAKAYQRGMKARPNWKDADFSLEKLYGENGLAKAAHMEALATAASDAPLNGELLLLVGLQLQFDGQVERARPFFEKASTLLADPALNLAALLKPTEEAEEAP